MRSSQPSARSRHLPALREMGSDPERAAHRAPGLVYLEVGGVRSLEQREVVVLAAEHVGRGGEELQVIPAQWLHAVGRRQPLVSLRPLLIGVGVTPARELGDEFRHGFIIAARRRSSGEGSPTPRPAARGPFPGGGSAAAPRARRGRCRRRPPWDRRAPHHPRHPGQDDRPGAHRAGLQRHVEHRVVQPPGAQRPRCLAQRQDLAVGGGVSAQLALVRAPPPPPRRRRPPRSPRARRRARARARPRAARAA